MAKRQTDEFKAAYDAALEAAAKEAEAWWEMFDFASFEQNDSRRYANPNHIAARIRSLKFNPKEDESE
jgi:hypothetical protein